MMVNVTVIGMDSLQGALDTKVIKAAMFRGINRTLDSAATRISTTVREQYNVSKAAVDGRIRKRKCSDYSALQGEVSLSAGEKMALPLIQFGAVERRNLEQGSVKTMKGRNGFYSQRLKRKVGAGGVTYKIMRSAGKGFSGNAFIIPGASGSMQVVRRTPGKKGRWDLKEKRVISVAGMMMSKTGRLVEQVSEFIDTASLENFNRELKYYADRYASGAVIGNSNRRAKGTP